MYPHYNYPHVWLNQPYLLWPWIHSPKVSSLKPKLRRLSANLGVSVKSPFPRSGHQTWLGNPRTKWRFSLVRWELEKSSNYSWGISTVDDNKRVPFEHDASLGRMVVNHWSNGLNGVQYHPIFRKTQRCWSFVCLCSPKHRMIWLLKYQPIPKKKKQLHLIRSYSQKWGPHCHRRELIWV